MSNSNDDNSGRSDLLITPDRFDAICNWAQYIREQPVSVWGPQHRELVDAQLASAQALEKTPEKEHRIQRIVEDLSAEN